MKEKVKWMITLYLLLAGLPLLILALSGQKSSSEEQVLFIVLKEIPADYSMEAIKAQAIIARSNLAYCKEHDMEEPDQISQEDLENLIDSQEGSDFYDQVKTCVKKTSGQIMTVNGEAIYAPYHSVSAGATRNGSSSYPYLKSVSCRLDINAAGYLNICYFDQGTFPTDVEITARDSAGYVIALTVDGQEMSGEAFRNKYGLNSSCFSIKETDQGIRVITKGIGHGLGLSQYTANIMAQKGQNYEKILKFFFNGIQLCKSANTSSN